MQLVLQAGIVGCVVCGIVTAAVYLAADRASGIRSVTAQWYVDH